MRGAEVKDVIDFLKESGEFLRDNPSCSYIVREVIKVLENCEDPLFQDFGKFINEIWDSSTSTISCGIPLEMQSKFIGKIAEYILEMVVGVISADSPECKYYFGLKKKWEDDFESFWKELVKSLWKVRIKRNEKTEINMKNSNVLEMRLLEIVNEYGLLFEASEPIFLLRSGFRSFYFINPFYFVSPVYLGENSKLKEKVKKFEEFLEELFYREIGEYINDKKIVTVLLQKRFGEDPGTVALGPLLTNLGIPFFVYDLGARYIWPKGPMQKLNPSIDEIDVIPLIDLTTTGRTAKSVIETCRTQFGQEPPICVMLINRGSEDPKLNGTKPFIVSTWERFIETFGIVPDLLKVSISTKNEYIGHVWPSIVLFRNHLYDIYLYEKSLNKKEEEKIIMEKYRKVKAEIEKFIVEAYGIEEKDGKIYLFGWYDTKKERKKIVNYLTGFHIFCWNHIYERIFGKDDRDYLERPLDYLMDSLEFDKNEKITVPFLPNLLREEIEKYNILFIDPLDKVQRILVRNTQRIISHIDRKLQEIFSKIDPPWGAVITRKDAERIVERRIENCYDALIKLFEKLWDHPDLGPVEGKEAFEDYRQFAKEHREIVWRIVEKQYKIK